MEAQTCSKVNHGASNLTKLTWAKDDTDQLKEQHHADVADVKKDMSDCHLAQSLLSFCRLLHLHLQLPHRWQSIL